MSNNGKKPKVLIVDDSAVNQRLLCTLLKKSGYIFDTCSNGIEALEKTEKIDPDLILLDVIMPEMDGYETCRRLKSNPETEHIPVVMVTSLEDKESRLKGLESGANDFILKPFDVHELELRAKNLLRVKEYEDFLKTHNELLDEEVKKKTSQLNDSYIDTIYRLTRTAEFKDEGTAAHIKRAGYFASAIAKELGWPDNRAETIFYAAPMHDIGKIGIPSSVLLKHGPLNDEEFALIKRHTIIGANILTGSVSEILKMAENIALSHHERWDGSGYPNGLKGEEIPLEARIYSIADQYDALRSPRPYKLGYTHKEALEIITIGDGRTMPEHFDPQIIEAFMRLSDEFNRLFEDYQD